MKCILCDVAVPTHLAGHPRTKFCGKFCRNKAQRLKDTSKRAASLAAWKAKNPERVKELRRMSAARCKEKGRARTAAWAEKNAERMRAFRRKWKEENPWKAMADVRRRQLIKSKASPAWLTKVQKREIEDFYKKSIAVSKATGIPHDVDHIIPIRGKAVCGLHVPWNLQVISRADNHRKSNRVA